MTIRRDDWLHALDEALARQPGVGLTSNELCEETGVGLDKLMRRLKLLQQQGKLVVERGWRPSIDGVVRHVPVYRIKDTA